MRRTSVAAVMGAAAWLVGANANAQAAADRASTRRNLIAQAQAASDTGDTMAALDCATRTASIAMTPSLRLFIAEQQERIGRWLDAYASASLCEHEASVRTELNGRDDIAAACRELVAEARSHIVRLRLRVLGVEANNAGLVIYVNGRRAAIDGSATSLAADPGPIVVDARRGDRVLARRDLVVESGQAAEVTLDARSALDVGPAPLTNSRDRSRRVPIGAVVVGAVGVASSITAAVFFGLREAAQGSCVREGSALVCPSSEAAARANTAITYNTVADITLGVGIAGLAGSVLWFVLDRRASERTAVHATVSPTAQGVFGAVEFRL